MCASPFCYNYVCILNIFSNLLFHFKHGICAIWNSPADPANPPEVVAASAPQTLPSTRAGGQDDVS